MMINTSIPKPFHFPTEHFKSYAGANNTKVRINNIGNGGHYNLIKPQPQTQTKDNTTSTTEKALITRKCKCGRRHIIGDTLSMLLLHSSLPSSSLAFDDHPTFSSLEMLKKIHPPRSDWYEEFYASVLNNGMKEYEAEIAAYKSQLFDELRGQAKEVLEIGIGTGPNLKYYAKNAHRVYGVDPNKKMEKYARDSAEAAGLPSENFKFIQAVGEALPLKDASVDAVIGTLVLCSVGDIQTTLQEVKRVLKPGGLYLFIEHIAAKEGTSLRFLQTILNPLQELLADGCHLTRETGKYISEAGFSNMDSSTTFIPSFLFVNPHLYGIAQKSEVTRLE